MAAPAFSIRSQQATLLVDPTLRAGLMKYARRRLPPAEVEDLVQNTLADALIADSAPSDPGDFRRWVHGIARHKIADSHRRRGRLAIPSSDIDQNASEPSTSIAELGEWIESELPKTDDAQRTLHWLLREGDGETLDEIARGADLPAPRVRQRVSRLRRHLHARWLALGAAGLLTLLGAGTLFQRKSQPADVPPSIARETPSPFERARSLRQNALQRCAEGAYPECIAGLDQAKALDPSGEEASAIGDARRAAANAARGPLIPDRPAGSPSSFAPDTKYAPKQRAPSKAKPTLPGKPVPQSAPLGAIPKTNAPSNKGSAYDPLAGSSKPAKEPKTKKY